MRSLGSARVNSRAARSDPLGEYAGGFLPVLAGGLDPGPEAAEDGRTGLDSFSNQVRNLPWKRFVAFVNEAFLGASCRPTPAMNAIPDSVRR